MALELEFGTLPHSTECNASDVELVSLWQHPTAVGRGLLLGLGETMAEGGRDWPFQSGRNHPRSREAAHFKCFYLIISNANAGMASGA